MSQALPVTEEPREPLVIHATRGFDNYTFALDIYSRDDLLRVFEGQVLPARRVTIAFNTRADFEEAFGPVEPQVVTLLTGLSPERLKAQGWRVEVRDSKSDELLWSSR